MKTIVRILGFAALAPIFLSGCATTILSDTILRDHRRLHVYHEDADHVYSVDSAAAGSDGGVRILYTGAHGPRYRRTRYQMRLHPTQLEKARDPERSVSANGQVPEIVRVYVPVQRRATRESDSPPAGDAWNALPLATFQTGAELASADLSAYLRQVDLYPVVVFSPGLRHLPFPSHPPSRDSDTPSIGIGLLYPGASPGDPPLLLIPCVPKKTGHDYSGLGYRMLYPFAIVWDVATAPVQAVIIVYVLTTSSGGWLF